MILTFSVSRQGHPKGMAMTATVVATFHRTFITSMDRAFTIQCIYLELDHMVSRDLLVRYYVVMKVMEVLGVAKYT